MVLAQRRETNCNVSSFPLRRCWTAFEGGQAWRKKSILPSAPLLTSLAVVTPPMSSTTQLIESSSRIASRSVTTCAHTGLGTEQGQDVRRDDKTLGAQKIKCSDARAVRPAPSPSPSKRIERKRLGVQPSNTSY